MSNLHKHLCAALGVALLPGLSACSPGEKASPCDVPVPGVSCGGSCVSDAQCGAGTHCESGTCSAECVMESVLYGCGAAGECDRDGRCKVAPDAGTDAATDSSAEASTVTHDASRERVIDAPALECGEVRIAGNPITPNVVFIIDQSTSMDWEFDRGVSRWNVLKDTLLADSGLIAELEDQVRFGAVLYSSDNQGTCPDLTSQSFALGNLETIRGMFGSADTLGETPTGDSIEKVLDNMEAEGSIVRNNLDTEVEPTVFILATDGEPDTCEQPNPQQGQAEAVAAVERAYRDYRVRTYVIAVAQERELSEQHLTDLANAGAGTQPGEPDAPSFRVNNQSGLRDALLHIVGGEISCEVPLKGRVTAKDPCEGSVELNGVPLECNGENGWRLLDDETVEVLGSACEDLQKGAYLEAVFDCHTAILI